MITALITTMITALITRPSLRWVISWTLVALRSYYWITGRVDDVINVSGHRIGTAEVESALVNHHACAEAAVVGYVF
jgi:acyl-CoA synthetase (AMP-forming)/AMP-acid ligase II